MASPKFPAGATRATECNDFVDNLRELAVVKLSATPIYYTGQTNEELFSIWSNRNSRQICVWNFDNEISDRHFVDTNEKFILSMGWTFNDYS